MVRLLCRVKITPASQACDQDVLGCTNNKTLLLYKADKIYKKTPFFPNGLIPVSSKQQTPSVLWWPVPTSVLVSCEQAPTKCRAERSRAGLIKRTTLQSRPTKLQNPLELCLISFKRTL